MDTNVADKDQMFKQTHRTTKNYNFVKCYIIKNSINVLISLVIQYSKQQTVRNVQKW